MWLKDPAEFVEKFNLSGKQAVHFRCTGEHLIPHSSGGKCNAGNIVAACKFCNQARHRRKVVKTPKEFRKFVRSRLAKRRWNFNIRPE
jgi:5-methylcytosine-specific restriction endonuclease McrA